MYLDLIHTYAQRYSTEIIAYCLMDNHVHHVMVPKDESALSRTLKATHMRYASVVNGQQGWTGHLWQERFFSAPLDDDYLWTVLRYIERNPVKAGMVTHASDYRWSSAKAHCHHSHDPLLTQDPHWTKVLRQRQDWDQWLTEEDEDDKIRLLRERTRRDLPCGSPAFMHAIEEKLGRSINPRPRGRPRKKE